MCDIITKPILWGLDPLFHVHVKVLVRIFKDMVPGRGTSLQDPPVYFYVFNPRSQPRPIRLIAIAGVIVQKQDFRKLTRFILDDGTGTAHCMYWNSVSIDVLGTGNGLNLGQFAHVLGKLEWKNGLPSILATRIQRAASPDAELMWWLDVAAVYKSVYSVDFKLTVPTDTEEGLPCSPS